MKIKIPHRRKRSAGFSQVEVMVASAILMITVSQSASLFTDCMQATGTVSYTHLTLPTKRIV